MTKVIKVGGVLLEDPQKAVHAIRGVQTGRAAVVNGGGATDFCARILDPNDKPVTDFVVTLHR